MILQKYTSSNLFTLSAITTALCVCVVEYWRKPFQSMARKVLVGNKPNKLGGFFSKAASLFRSFVLSRKADCMVLVERWNEQTHYKIQSVLEFWFGQFPPDEAQKNLWMIASSSIETRTKVDSQIANDYTDLMKSLMEGDWRHWTRPWCGWQGKVAAIVVLDQFSRHINRHNGASKLIYDQNEIDSLAYDIANQFLKDHNQEIDSGMIPLPMVVFALMPYRHQNSIPTVKFTQDTIHRLESIEEQMTRLLSRFRKATNRRMAVLQDESRRIGGLNDSGVDGDVNNDDEILEAFPFEADMGPSESHVVTKTIENFLKEHEILGQKGTKGDAPIIVSLSGGVDSMVVISVLVQMKSRLELPMQIHAVHIDYGNRPESGAEADYVKRHCMNHGVLFHLRKISEVTRGITARDDYEKISRNIRYNLYREVLLSCTESSVRNQTSKLGVMLGHHKGDLRENVLSNAHKGCGPLDLSGMTPTSRNNGVALFRPMLTLEKSAIFDYAHRFGVPYFKDTTPNWSTRGKLRKRLLPLLKDIYGDGSMENLSSLAVESDQARTLLFSAVLKPFLDQVEHRRMGIMFHTSPWKAQPHTFWKLALREALHSAQLGMFSEKSVKAFLERVRCSSPREGWLQCKRDYAVFLRHDGKIFIFFPASFPFRACDQFRSSVGEVVKVNEARLIGPWRVTVTLKEAKNGGTSASEKVFSTFEELMEGKLSYLLQIPFDGSNPSTLRLVPHFSKLTRPPAWKGVDAKIESVLPLVGIGEGDARLLSTGVGSCFALVELVLVDNFVRGKL